MEFLEKLAALTPRPAINLIPYHGGLAPHARWRPAVVAYGRPEGDAVTAPHEPMGRAEAERGGAARPRYWTWAALMRRAFLVHLGLPGARDGPEPAVALSRPRDDQPAPPFALPS